MPTSVCPSLAEMERGGEWGARVLPPTRSEQSLGLCHRWDTPRVSPPAPSHPANTGRFSGVSHLEMWARFWRGSEGEGHPCRMRVQGVPLIQGRAGIRDIPVE